MTALSFPSNPTIGQQYVSAVGTSWLYDGVKWTVGQVVEPPVVVTPEVPPVIPTPTPPPPVIYTTPNGISYTLTFPSTPVIGQQYISEVGTSWLYDGVKWTVGQLVSPPVVVTPEVPPVIPTPAPATTVYNSLFNISFPASPTIGQIYTAPDGIAYIWRGDRWAGYGGNTILPATTVTTATLPKATQTTLGGVIIGPGIINTDGTISVNTESITTQVVAQVAANVAATITTQPATKTTAGQVVIGDNINVTTNGTISVPVATTGSLGVVKPGANVTIDGAGAIGVSKGAGINTVSDIPDVNTTAGGAALNDGALLIYNASSQRWDTIRNLRSDEMDGGFF